MRSLEPGGRGVSRRALLLTGLIQPAAPVEPGQVFPSESLRYSDSATEAEVVRLTGPACSTVLPPACSRAINRRSNAVVAASDRTGSWQLYWIELPGGKQRLLSGAANLAPEAFTLSPDDRSVYYFDGPVLQQLPVGNLKERELARVGDGWERRGALTMAEDGTSIFFAEARGQTSRLRRVRLPRGPAETVFEGSHDILWPQPNPRRATVLWMTGSGELCVAAFDGSGMRRIETQGGRVLDACWSPDGRAVLYLIEPSDPKQLISIREQELDSRAETLVARTSQFAAFSRNANATVFLGASRSKASPVVLLMLRLTRRELTLCEHRASDPAKVVPLFTPNSQRLVFQSDRWGKPVLLTMNVERLVEKTES